MSAPWTDRVWPVFRCSASIANGQAAMLELRTLGAVDLRRADGGRIESVLLHTKRVSLLAYLCAGYPARLQRRDTLVALLWPDLDTAHARAALRHELYELRQQLGPGVMRGEGAEAVGVDPARIWCDVQAFESALDDGRPGDALVHWHGEFLPGLHVEGGEFDQWLDHERDHLSRRAVEATRRLFADAERTGDALAAVSWARRLTELVPYDETGWHCLMAILDRCGDRAGALAAFDALAARLRAELEVEPSPETQALAQRIRERATAFAGSAVVTVSPASRGPAPPALQAGVLIGLAPVENRSGDAALDRLASRLTDRIARGLAQLRYIHLVRGKTPPNARAVVSGSIYSDAGRIEVQTCVTEPASAGRVLGATEPMLLEGESAATALDTAVKRILALVHTHFNPRVGTRGEGLPFPVASWDSVQEATRGVELFGNARFAEAAEHLRRAYELDRTNLNAGIFAGIAMAYGGDPASADAYVTAAMAQGAPLPDYERHFGEWLLADLRGNRAEAYRAALDATRVSRHPATWATAGLEALRMNRPREAFRMFQSVDLTECWTRNFTEIWEAMGSGLHMLGEHETELAAMLQARAQIPESLHVLRGEVRAQAGLGDSAAVLRLVKEAVTLPHDAGAAGTPLYTTPAHVAWTAAQELEAHDEPDAAVRARGVGLAWLERADHLTRADRLLGARLLHESADDTRAHEHLLELQPFDDPESLGLWGLVAAARGHAETAGQAIERLERLDSRYLCGRHLLAATGIHAALGDGDMAMATLRRALAAGLPFGVELHALPILRPLAGRSDLSELVRPRG